MVFIQTAWHFHGMIGRRKNGKTLKIGEKESVSKSHVSISDCYYHGLPLFTLIDFSRQNLTSVDVRF